jgi:F-type H+-transporting ATPase subunit b
MPIQPIFLFLQETASEHAAQPGLVDALIHSNILNFLIAFGFLFWVVKRFKLASLLDDQQQKVVKALQEAEAKRAKALADMTEIEKRTAKLSQEVEALIGEAQKTAELVAETIVKNAETEADKIVSNAKKRIELEQKIASRELEERLMKEAIHGARQLLESTLSDDDRHRSVEDFVANLPDLYEKELGR